MHIFWKYFIKLVSYSLHSRKFRFISTGICAICVWTWNEKCRRWDERLMQNSEEFGELGDARIWFRKPHLLPTGSTTFTLQLLETHSKLCILHMQFPYSDLKIAHFELGFFECLKTIFSFFFEEIGSHTISYSALGALDWTMGKTQPSLRGSSVELAESESLLFRSLNSSPSLSCIILFFTICRLWRYDNRVVQMMRKERMIMIIT